MKASLRQPGQHFVLFVILIDKEINSPSHSQRHRCCPPPLYLLSPRGLINWRRYNIIGVDEDYEHFVAIINLANHKDSVCLFTNTTRSLTSQQQTILSPSLLIARGPCALRHSCARILARIFKTQYNFLYY